jgi:hypothetical protein
MGIAVFAIKAYSVFLDRSLETKSATEVAKEILAAVRTFDTVQ